MDAPSNDARAAHLEALSDPVRRELYRLVATSADAVTRGEVAEVAGIGRTLAAYHLDKLVEAGLLTYNYARDDGRTGPGAGRPAKRYRPTQAEVSITVPPRDYAVLASLLADAASADESGVVLAALIDAAEREGSVRADPSASLMSVLVDRGYEPDVTADGDIVMRNCPFHQVVEQHQGLVCGLNEALIRGCLRGRGDNPEHAELDPHPGQCCVVIHPGDGQATPDN